MKRFTLKTVNDPTVRKAAKVGGSLLLLYAEYKLSKRFMTSPLVSKAISRILFSHEKTAAEMMAERSVMSPEEAAFQARVDKWLLERMANSH